ncbi:MAG TPA: hypothetical protein VMY42_29090 [Thermoguttaceae bacterium]|nr:hypothetical protein [Thermoguttaceae bacterium]
MAVRIITDARPGDHTLQRDVRIEGIDAPVTKGTIEFDYNAEDVLAARLEVCLKTLDVSVEAELFTTINGRRYKLVEV